MATVFLFNFLKDNTPFQAINIKKLSHFYLWLKSLTFHIFYVEYGNFYFSAYYFYDANYPIGRNYYIKERDLSKISDITQISSI